MRGYSVKTMENNLLEVKNDHERTSALFCLNSKNIYKNNSKYKWDMGSYRKPAIAKRNRDSIH